MHPDLAVHTACRRGAHPGRCTVRNLPGRPVTTSAPAGASTVKISYVARDLGNLGDAASGPPIAVAVNNRGLGVGTTRQAGGWRSRLSVYGRIGVPFTGTRCLSIASVLARVIPPTARQYPRKDWVRPPLPCYSDVHSSITRFRSPAPRQPTPDRRGDRTERVLEPPSPLQPMPGC